MINDPKFITAKDWFEKLRDDLIETIESIDENKFEITNWNHKGEGGGKILQVVSTLKTNVFSGFLRCSKVFLRFPKVF